MTRKIEYPNNLNDFIANNENVFKIFRINNSRDLTKPITDAQYDAFMERFDLIEDYFNINKLDKDSILNRIKSLDDIISAEELVYVNNNNIDRFIFPLHRLNTPVRYLCVPDHDIGKIFQLTNIYTIETIYSPDFKPRFPDLGKVAIGRITPEIVKRLSEISPKIAKTFENLLPKSENITSEIVKTEEVVGYDLGDMSGIPVHKNKFDVLNDISNPFN